MNRGGRVCAVAITLTAGMAGCLEGAAHEQDLEETREESSTPPHSDPTASTTRATTSKPPTSSRPTSQPTPTTTGTQSSATTSPTTTSTTSPTTGATEEPSNSTGPPWPEPHEYTQAVWINWGQDDFDVLVLGVTDPVVGAAIKRGIELWQKGIPNLDPKFGAAMQIRVHWAPDGVPPSGFSPDIVFIPQGFYAVNTYPCLANAPMLAGWGEMYHTAAHEFGHCLGLGHVFARGVEYQPAKDAMGGGVVGHPTCPSNLNLEILRKAWKGESGQLGMPASYYFQAASC